MYACASVSQARLYELSQFDGRLLFACTLCIRVHLAKPTLEKRSKQPRRLTMQ